MPEYKNKQNRLYKGCCSSTGYQSFDMVAGFFRWNEFLHNTVVCGTKPGGVDESIPNTINATKLLSDLVERSPRTGYLGSVVREDWDGQVPDFNLLKLSRTA